jgi:hypothetical protein
MTMQLKGKKWQAARRKARRSLAKISDEEDAQLTRAAAADPDNPIIDEQMFVRMRPAIDVAPEIVRRARRQRAPTRRRPSRATPPR